jgi:predicted house-cleaning noncanonical NTP pyrophosphatase (MazG superfamily)
MKLVRDLIPQIIEESGKSCEYHIANYDEYKTRLYEKMREELDEFINTPCEEEAADMYEVLCAICRLHKLNMWNVKHYAADKLASRGGFGGRIILEEVSGENRGSG